MNCSACGSPLPDGSVFCESCGARLGAASVPASPAAAAWAGATQPAPVPSATAIAEMSGMLIKSLSLGERLAAMGSLAAVLGFFLPWVSGPDLKSLGNLSTLLGPAGVATTSYSGLDAARVWGATYFILVAAVTSGVLFFVASKATFSGKLSIGGFQVMIGSLIGPGVVFALLFIPFMQSVAGSGLWLTGLGFCSIVAGGLVTIGHLGHMVR